MAVAVRAALAALGAASTASAIDNGLGLAPPMGWSANNAWHWIYGQDVMEASYEALASRSRSVDGKPTSMADVGYINANVDDAWQSCDYQCSAHHGNPPKFPAGQCGTGVNGTYHNASGWPLVNTTRYPDMKAMTAKAHSLGLRAGFYMNTCECRESNWAPDQLHAHYVGDTSFLFEMGFDNVKIDSCSEFRDLQLWEELLNTTGRAYIIEDCFQGGIVGNLSWCPFTHFRSGGDLSQGWNDIANKLQQVRPYTRNVTMPTSRPGCWAFPDMLQVGQVSPNTQEANQAHFGAWAIVSSPLILGMNLSDQAAMDVSWPIVTNKEVVAVNQQWAGHPGKLVREWYPSPGHDGPAEGSFAWAMPCDGTAAQTGWTVDAADHAVKHGDQCLEKASDDSIALATCDSTSAAQRFSLDQASGALIHGDFTPPPPPPPPPPPGKRHSTCSALQNDTSVVGPSVVNTHSNKERCGVTLEQCCAMCDSDEKCTAFTLDPDANWGGTCVGKTFCWTYGSYKGIRHGGSTFGSKGALPPPPPKPAPGASCVTQQDFFGTVSHHLSLKPIKSLDDLHSCDHFNLTANGTLLGKNLGVFMDDTPVTHNDVSGMPARRLPCLVARPEIPPLLAGPLQIWAKPQPLSPASASVVATDMSSSNADDEQAVGGGGGTAVAVFAVHMGQMESGEAHQNQTITVNFTDVPWMQQGVAYKVRDLYAKADLAGTHTGSYTLTELLAPLSSRMLLFTPSSSSSA